MPRRVDWALLPSELLPLVYKKLPDLADFVRFRAVCKPWRSAAPASDPPPQLPWLLARRKTAFEAELHFYSLGSGRTYRVRDLGGRSRFRASGACHGYVLCTDLSSAVLYNPVSGALLLLPPTPYPPWHCSVVHVADPAGSGGDCVVVSTCLATQELSYCRPGDTKWNSVAGHGDMRQHAYHTGRFFVNRAAGDTVVIDSATLAVKSVVPPPSEPAGDADFLVESSGKILRVIRVQRDGQPSGSMDGHCFLLYKLELRPDKPEWIKVESLGDCALFFDDHGHGFSLASNDSAGLKKNSIYFVHERRTWVDVGEYRFLCRYSLEEGVVDKVVPLAEKFGNTWIVPSLC